MAGWLTLMLIVAVAGREAMREFNVFQLMEVRSILGLLMLYPLIHFNGGFSVVRTARVHQHIARNLIHYGAQLGWFLALTLIPIGQVVAIEFTMPIWTAILAAAFLGERMTAWKVTAIVLGIVGVIVIVRPATGEVNPGQLIALARQRLDKRLKQRVDPEDIVQSVYKSFFIRHRDGQLDVVNWQSLWGLLTLITLRKCADRAEYFRADRRDVNREASAGADQAPIWQGVVGREPSPEEATLLAETVEALLSGLDQDERGIIEMSLQGHSTQEISTALGRAERSVRRLRERVRLQLERADV